jgi:hypothetical protein
MNILNTEIVVDIFKDHREISLEGKWITLKNIEGLIKNRSSSFEVKTIGGSEERQPIYSLKIGRGTKKILLWSQMHGNESTGTKALFDLFNYLEAAPDAMLSQILDECTLLFIPMLNPDGADNYTRVNGQNIDLNRDAVNQVAKESQLLRKTLERFNPMFCFNLHDQRTIFGVEGTKNPATVSFLAPSEEITRAITEGRKQTMNVIVAMNLLLQQIIPNHVGRYTDEFYPTATGDNFQKLGYNTVLIESGHFYNDYDREESRKFTFYALLQGLYHIATATHYSAYKAYFDIPNNQKIFFDIIDRNEEEKLTIVSQYRDEITNGKLVSKLENIEVNNPNNYLGHNENVFEN